MSFYRKPSPLEVTYFGYDTPNYSPMVNQFITEGRGSLDLERWRQAVAQVAEVNPGVRLKLKGRWGWRYWDDQGPPPKVERIESDWDGSSSEGAPCLGAPMNLRKGPLSEVILIQGRYPKVLYRTHHGIMDGQGMLHFMAEIFRALRGEPLLGSRGTETDWDIAQRIEHPSRDIKEGDCIPVTPISSQPDERGCRYVRLHWQGKYSKLIPKLILASCNIAWETHGEGKILFRIPSDLRRYLDENAPFSCANAIGAIDLEITPDDTVNSIQSRIIKALRAKKDLSVFPDNMKLAYWLPSGVFVAKPKQLERLHQSGRYRMTGTISSLGELDVNDFSYDDFQTERIYGVPIPFENRPLFIGFCVNPEGLHASIGMPKALATHQQLMAFCEKIKAQLDAF